MATMHRPPRYPYSLVWSPIPFITWLMPFIGHMGASSAEGRTYDFAGPFTVNEDRLLFGQPTRFLPIKGAGAQPKGSQSQDSEVGEAAVKPEGSSSSSATAWDACLGRAANTYRAMPYNIMTNNCHCFVAHFMNQLCHKGGGWDMVNLAALMFVRGRYTSLGGLLHTWLPFAVLVTLGGYFGRLMFLYVYAGICVPLLTWFLVYTYCCWRDITL